MVPAYHSQVTTPRQTPLHEVHERLGAAMTSFAGWQMPLRYASETAEHQAVRTAAGLFDLSHMGEITVAGPGAGAALDYALTGNLSALPPGRARYTMICADDGGVLDDLVVYRLDEDQFLVAERLLRAWSQGFVEAVITTHDPRNIVAQQLLARMRPLFQRPQHAVGGFVQLENRGARHEIDERLPCRLEPMMLARGPCHFEASWNQAM